LVFLIGGFGGRLSFGHPRGAGGENFSPFVGVTRGDFSPKIFFPKGSSFGALGKTPRAPFFSLLGALFIPVKTPGAQFGVLPPGFPGDTFHLGLFPGRFKLLKGGAPTGTRGAPPNFLFFFFPHFFPFIFWGPLGSLGVSPGVWVPRGGPPGVFFNPGGFFPKPGVLAPGGFSPCKPQGGAPFLFGGD